MLGDAAGLALDDVGFADVVQQRGLTVVDVSHDRYDRRTRDEVFLAVLAVVGDGLLNLHRDEFGLVAELLGDDHERLGVETLVDRHHQTQVHAGHDDLRRRDVHHRGQLADGHELRDLERRTLHFLAFELLVHALGDGLALVLAVFRAFALGPLGRQTRQGVLYLLRNLFVAHFRAHDRFGGVLALVAASFARTGLVLTSAAVLALSSRTVAVVVLTALALTVAAALCIALRGFADVDFLLLEAFALMLAACDEARHVHRAEHLRTGEGHRLGAEDVVLRGLGLRLRRGGGGRSRLCRGRCRGRSGFGCGSLCGFGLRSRGGRFPLRGLLHGGCGLRGGRRCGRCGFRRFGRLRLGSRSGCGSRFHGLRSFRGLLRFRGGSRRLGCGFHGLGCGLGLGSRSRLGLGREVDLAEELRLLNLVLDADDVAFDDNLLLFLALLLPGFFEGYGRLLQGDAFADRITCAGGAAVRPELLLQNGVSLGIDQRVGRSVALDALLLQEVGDGVQPHLELLCNLNEP